MTKRTFRLTNSFKKDLKKHYLELVNEHWAIIVNCLANNTPIPEKYLDHALTGNWNGFRDCHVKNDLVLIYRVLGDVVEFHRLNTHSELFS